MSSWLKSYVCLHLSPFHVIQEIASQWQVSVWIVTLRSHGMDSDVVCMHSTCEHTMGFGLDLVRFKIKMMSIMLLILYLASLYSL